MHDEGYAKYTAEHAMSPAIEVLHWAELNEARTKLLLLGLLRINSDGIGYGNLSIRFRENEFLISGTATGAPPALRPEDYCLVKSFDIAKNHVVSMGPIQASSESMTHGAIYNSCPQANCVIHIHSREIFDGMIRDRYTSTPETAAYGTPEIAHAIAKCVQEAGGDADCIVLAGHDEGIVSYAPSVERALTLILELHDKYPPARRRA
jgi:ribulose-5-phosphate 4-epimerase/fuculose-1-phosphate aldolase